MASGQRGRAEVWRGASFLQVLDGDKAELVMARPGHGRSNYGVWEGRGSVVSVRAKRRGEAKTGVTRVMASCVRASS